MPPRFSQGPTLGEFIEVAKRYGWTVVRLSALGDSFGRQRIKYLRRRARSGRVEIVDLLVSNESERLARSTLEALCENSGVPLEDFE